MTLTSGILLFLAAVFFALAIHPFITYPLSLALIGGIQRRRRSEPKAADPFIGDFAICVCAYNEEKIIAAKIENLLALREREPGLQILIYVDAASDRTAELLQPYASQIDLHVSPRRYGKTHGMNLLVNKARAPVVVFTDANVMMAMDSLQNLRRYFGDPAIGCVCGNLIYTNGEESVTSATGSLYWRLEEKIKSLEEDTGSVMGADGSLFAIRRALHHAPPDHIIDDMYVSFRILCDGYRIVQAKDVTAYEHSVTSAAEEFRRKSRIACQAFNVHRLLWPRLRRLNGLTLYKYVSHKFLRWVSIYSLLLAALLLEFALIGAGMHGLAIGLVGAVVAALFAGYRWSLKPFAQLTDVLLSLAGAGLGIWKSLRGEQYQTWAPAASIRKSAQ